MTKCQFCRHATTNELPNGKTENLCGYDGPEEPNGEDDCKGFEDLPEPDYD